MYKYIVFDLDETLGHFTELGIFYDSLSSMLKNNLNQNTFNNLCDIFPKVFRPGIFSILSYLIRKKSKEPNIKIVIYTNNQGPKSWTYMIKNYIEYKLKNNNIFDKIICAYKINNHQVEMCRTTHNKTVDDLMRCTNAPINSKFVFLDDQYHKEMINDMVSYINVKSYNYQISFKKMVDIFLNSNLGKHLLKQEKLCKKQFKINIINKLNKYNFHVIEKSKEEYKVDKVVTKKMMVHLQDFFESASNKSKTKKNKFYNLHNKTKKKF